jgi:apolipoprotein N-acyltransferase
VPRKRFRLFRLRLNGRDAFLCVLSGLLLTLCFDPLRLGFIAPFCLVPLLAVLFREGRHEGKLRGFQAGSLTGLVHFGTLLYWIVQLDPSASFTVRWLLVPGTVLIAIYLSLYLGLFGFLTAGARNFFGPRRSLLLVPLFWGLQEWLRTHGALAFPWGVLSYALSYYPEAIQGAGTLGHLGVSYLLAASNAVLWAVMRGGAVNLRIFLASVWVVLVGGNWVYGNWIIRNTGEVVDEGKSVAVVQPNVDLALKWDPAYLEPTFTLIDSLSRRAASEGADLAVWPETSAPLYLLRSPGHLSRLRKVAREESVGVLIGFPHFERDPDGERYVLNAATLVTEEGAEGYYAKMHLLPFGEVIPFSNRFSILERVDFGEADFQPGREPVVFTSRAGKVGVLICFEAAFNEPSRSLIRNGADHLVNITNDGWFGGTPGPAQHGIMSVYRAVENGVWLFRSANTGISMVVDPFGRVLQAMGEDQRGLLIQEINLRRRPTFYTRHGYLAYFLLLSGNLVLFIFSSLSRLVRIGS